MTFSDVDAASAPGDHVAYLDRVRRLPDAVAWRLQSLALLELAPGSRVLEVGCGTGEDVAALAGAVGPDGAAFGVDRSATLLAVAAARHGDLANATFLLGDASALPIETGSLDACRCERTLQHVEDPEAAVAELARVLRPGGRAALLEPDWDTLVVEGSEPGLSAAILGSYTERLAQPRIGRSLRGLLFGHGFVEVAVGGQVLVVTELDAVAGGFGLEAAAGAAIEQGVVSAAAAEGWLADLRAADAAGRFCCANTGFVAVGTRGGRPEGEQA